MQGCVACRGTYLGSAWSEFRQVKEVWEEVFGGKPYSTHTLAISGAPHQPSPADKPSASCVQPRMSVSLAKTSCSRHSSAEAVSYPCKAGQMACTEEPSLPVSCARVKQSLANTKHATGAASEQPLAPQRKVAPLRGDLMAIPGRDSDSH